MNIDTISVTTRLLNALQAGQILTPRQIASRFNVRNPRDLVYRLRNDGYRINTVEVTNSKGITRRKYVMA